MTDPLVVARLRAAGCVWAEDEAAALEQSAATPDELEALVARRVAGEPLETVLGWVEFLGRRLVVAPGVFVPRRRTELLARLALTQVAERRRPDELPPVLVEMCCGVAPVASCFGWRGAEVHAADVSTAALACARANAHAADLHLGDLYDALPDRLLGRIDVIAANAPYVPTDADRDDAATRRATTSRSSRSTADPTVPTCTAGSQPARPTGWRRAGCCSSRPASRRPT